MSRELNYMDQECRITLEIVQNPLEGFIKDEPGLMATTIIEHPGIGSKATFSGGSATFRAIDVWDMLIDGLLNAEVNQKHNPGLYRRVREARAARTEGNRIAMQAERS